MSDNQHVFEIIRDVGYLIQSLKPKETVWFNVKKDDAQFFTARSSKGMPCGLSETSRAIEQAYHVTRGRPDPRNEAINELERKVALDVVEIKKAELFVGREQRTKEWLLNEAIDRANYFFREIGGDYTITGCSPQVRQVLELVLAAGLK